MESTSGVADGVVSVPQGGGAARGLGERFQPDLLHGSGNYSIPLTALRGPSDLRPSLSLRYSTGIGNGPLGMGWRLTGPLEIRRRTDRGVPRYDDARDEFVLSGAETLVPVGEGRYRPRSDTQFWDIRRTGDGWSVRTKDGRSHVLGSTANSRIADAAGRVFGWLEETELDVAGNAISYAYEFEGAQPYLSRVAWSIYEIGFDYAARPDPVHDGRAGFPLRMTRRLATIERRCPSLAQPVLARHTLVYAEAEGSGLSTLIEVGLEGVDENGVHEQYPPVKMRYSAFSPRRATYSRIEADVVGPPPLDTPGVALVDMNGDGLPDVLATDDSRHRWWANRGDGGFGVPRVIERVPAGMVIGRQGVTFADLRGDGAADMIRIDTRLNVAIENTAHGSWSRARIGTQQPAIAVSATATRMVDLDGDGVADLLQSTPDGYVLTYADGSGGWSRPQAVDRGSDAAASPDVSLDTPGVELADMTGDGLSDLVYLSSGRVEYWPYYGRGTWGARVRMQNAPVLPAGFTRDRLYLTDLDGDGIADLLYIDGDRVSMWLNRSGVAWSARYEIPFVPPPAVNSVRLCDFFGNGTQGVLWSALDRRGDSTGYRYLDIGAGGKPYLLTSIDSGLGGTTELSYATSSAVRSADARAGRPWTTYLPFPIQIVTQTRFTDALTGRTTTVHMRYRDGVYDGIEREFRGFARVEVETDGDAFGPPTVQVSVFDVGDLEGPLDALALAPEERARRRALAGSLVGLESYELASDGSRVALQSAATTWDARLEFAQNGKFVHFPRLVRTEARDHAPGAPDRIDAADYEHDANGNLAHKRRTGTFDGDPPSAALVTDQRISYASSATAYVVGLPAAIVTRDAAGRLIGETRHFYDGDAFVGLGAGRATRGLLTRTAELALASGLLPDGYAAEIDPAWGLSAEGEGWYRTAIAYERDELGNVTGQRDGLGATLRIAYDAQHVFPQRKTDSLGLVTEVDFDPRTGQPHELRLPDGTVTRYAYSPVGRLQAQWGTAGDGSLQLVAVFDVDYGDYAATPLRPSRAVSIRVHVPGKNASDYADTTNLDAVRDADAMCDYYDAEGNLIQRLRRAPVSTDPGRAWIVKQRRTWTAGNRPAADYPNVFAATPAFALDLPEATAVRFRYDGLARLVRVEQPDGGRVKFEYGTATRRHWTPNVADTGEPTLERHDAWGRLVEVTEPVASGSAAVTRYDLDEADRPRTITDASGRVSARYVYAGPGPAIRIEHADAGMRQTWRDAAGRVRRRRDSLGRLLQFEYDGEGRLTTALAATNGAVPAPVRTMTYTGSRLTGVSDGAVEERFEYDASGRIVATTVDAGGHPLVVRREYGLTSELRSVTMPDGTQVAYRYDDALLLQSIDGVVDGIDYDAHGSPDRIRFTGGPFTTYVRDPLMRRLQSATLGRDDAVLRSVALGYDVAGRIVSWQDRLEETTLFRTFAYDGASRLVDATLHSVDAAGAVLREDRYAYSPAGDLLRDDESGAGAMLYGDAARTGLLTRVQRAGGDATDFTYDAAGRPLVLESAHDLEYDVWDRLTGATLADGSAVRFAYDHAGRRVRKTVHRLAGDEVTHYAEKLFEDGPQGTRVNVYAAALLVAVKIAPAGGAATTACVLTDHLGSVLAACDPAGQVVQQQMYSPYGLTLRPAGNHDAYTGVRVDTELGLAQFGARYYVSSQGRFLTPDWWVIENPVKAMPIPQSLNAFGYAVGNPLTFRDPTGMWFGLDDLIVAGVGFVVGFIAGTIYGLATGQGWSSLLTGLEAGICGAAGAWLAYSLVGLAVGAVGLSASSGLGLGIVATATVAAGFNGVVGGMTQIYDWTGPWGILSFLSDSTWGIVGTTLGDLVTIVNVFYGSGAKYRDDLSHRQNRHVYDGGFGFGQFAFTQGNVTSNLNGRGNSNLADHETLHITQNRIFGPIFTVTYLVWLVVGGIVGGAIGIFLDQGIGKSAEDLGYYDNPWEEWAYDKGGSAQGGALQWY